MEEDGSAVSHPVKRSSKATAFISEYISKINEDGPPLSNSDEAESEESSEISVESIGDVVPRDDNLQSLAVPIDNLNDDSKKTPKKRSKKGSKKRNATPGRGRTKVDEGGFSSEDTLWGISNFFMDGINETNRIIVNPLIENVASAGIFVVDNIPNTVIENVTYAGSYIAENLPVNTVLDGVVDTANSAGAIVADSSALKYVYDAGAFAGTIASDIYSYSFGFLAADDTTTQSPQVQALVETGSPYP